MAEPERVVQAYRYALDPTPEQESRLRSHCGAQRFAFNWGLPERSRTRDGVNCVANSNTKRGGGVVRW
ncbi:helix-turn-helix domain-containing protein [Nocardia amikacinitolerans]|uniref:helix-turn-helix domain-containing protein n=1 Tax=Nocardia amikacinitolerans TaxID=756689 RepID=UPI0035562237|nr:Helix-turn-helix domain-containing protein [Nocardia amikacinitolerans]